jgi:hypothetical protein
MTSANVTSRRRLLHSLAARLLKFNMTSNSVLKICYHTLFRSRLNPPSHRDRDAVQRQSDRIKDFIRS